MSDDIIHPAGLLVLVGCTVVTGLAETRASLRCRREEAKQKEPRNALRAELRAKGLTAAEANDEAFKQFPRPRWEGPPKRTRRKVRGIAAVGAVVAAWPVAVAYAASRLPDQLEVGPIDHRTVTHWPITATGLLAGLWFGLAELGSQRGAAAVVVLFVGIGYVGHLLADAITRGGLPFFGPFKRRDFYLLPERVVIRKRTFKLRVLVGGKADALVMLAASGGTVALALTMGGWT